MLGPDGKPFKTRSGDVVKLIELLDEAEARALREGFAARHARLSSLRAELVQHFGPLAA